MVFKLSYQGFNINLIVFQFENIEEDPSNFLLNFIFGCIRSFVGSSFYSRAPTLENEFRLISSLDFLIKKFFEADDRVLYECTFAVGKKTSFRFEGTRSLLISCIISANNL